MKFLGKLALAAVPVCLIGHLIAEAGPKMGGDELYIKKCAACHGKDGKGKAPMAKLMNVDPAYLDMIDEETQKTSDADLNKIILEGQGKMNATKGVSAIESQMIVDYMRSLGPAKGAKSAEPMEAGKAEGKKAMAAAEIKGKMAKAEFDVKKIGALYKSKCASCHGAKGEGNAKLAKVFKAELSLNGSKNSVEKRIEITNKGMGKMPAYQNKLEKQEIMDLISYIGQFSEK